MIHPASPHIWIEAIVKYTYFVINLQAEGAVLAITQGNHPCRLLRTTQAFSEHLYHPLRKLQFSPHLPGSIGNY